MSTRALLNCAVTAVLIIFNIVYWMSGTPAIYIGYLAGSFFIALPFIYLTTAPDWHRSRMGRALMMQYGSLAAVFLLIMTSNLFGAYPHRELVRAVIYSAALVASIRLAVLLFQVRHGADWHTDRRSKK